MLKRSLYILLLFISVSDIQAQNLVPNANFANYINCPTFFGDFPVVDWVSPFPYTVSSPDYYSGCTSIPLLTIPNTYAGYQESDAGGAYAGIILRYSSLVNYREYIQVELTAPLEPGCYDVKVFYTFADVSGFSNRMGVYFSNGVPDPNQFLTTEPQLEELNIIQEQDDWIEFSDYYTTGGGETHITIGNFRVDSETDFITGTGIEANSSYILIDSVLVEYAQNDITDIDVNIGPDLLVCEDDYPITISSNHPGLTNTWSTGETGASVEVTQPGTYELFVTGNCSLGSDVIVIESIQEPELDLDPDLLICEGSSSTISLDPNAGTYEWNDGSTSSDFTFVEEGIYSVSLTYDCGVEIDEIEVGVIPLIPPPEIEDIFICENEMPYVLNLSGYENIHNTIIWDNGTQGSTVVLLENGIYGVEVFNDCFSASDDFELTIIPELPTEIFPQVYEICSGDFTVIGPNVSQASYLWSDGSTEPFILTSEPGAYELTLTNLCGVQNYEFEVIEKPAEEISLGADLNICPGDSVKLELESGLEVEWNTGDVSSFIWVDVAGEYVASYQDECTIVSDSIIVSLNGAAPELTLSDSLLLCDGDTLDVSASTNPNGVNFEWNTGDTNSELEITQAGEYYVTAENNCGVALDTIIILPGEAAPEINVEETYQICNGDSLILNISTNGNINWSTGSTEESVAIYQDGTYWISAENSCAITSDTFTLSFIPKPKKPITGMDAEICSWDSILITANNLDTSFYWSTNETTPFIWVNTPGEYIITNENICETASDTIIISSKGDIPNVNLGDDVFICEGDTAEITAQGDFDEIIWVTGSFEITESFTESQLVTAGVSNECGIDVDSLQVTVYDEVPQIDLGSDLQLCSGDSILLETGVTNGIINWNTGETNPAIYVNESGLYIATLESSCGSSVDTIIVDILEQTPFPDLGNDTTICFADDLILSVDVPENIDILWNNNSTNSEILAFFGGEYWVQLSGLCGITSDTILIDNYSAVTAPELVNDTIVCEQEYNIELLSEHGDEMIEWNTGETTDNIVVTESGSYWVSISNPCDSKFDSVEVIFEQFPEPIDLMDSVTLCYGDQLELQIDQSDEVYVLWSTGSEGNSIIAEESGLYWVSASTFCDEYRDSIELTIREPVKFNPDVELDYEICEGETVEIDFSSTVAEDVNWGSNDNEFIKTLGEGYYQVMLLNMCKDTVIRFSITEIQCREGVSIYIPNIFSPNDDGINDYFGIDIPEGVMVEFMDFQVYNRWGEKIFFTENPDVKWDGKYKGNALNPGVYVYYVKTQLIIGDDVNDIEQSGDITIIK